MSVRSAKLGTTAGPRFVCRVGSELGAGSDIHRLITVPRSLPDKGEKKLSKPPRRRAEAG